ncbi:hypothetical protein CLAIMM_14430 isoform 2 [Cladophialophora immunda]|nr:hypothetical protein CLAIMM_14430 isoform 2 [Cladophialophora immunda]
MISKEPFVEQATNGQHGPESDSARDLFSLDHRTIIVTGAMGGMGVVVAKAILQSGADVIAIDRNAEPKASHTDLYRAAEKSGTVVAYYQCDISNLESTYAVFEGAVAAARYPLRGLVNCAAIGWVGPSISFPVEDAKRIIEVNLVGTLICAQAAAQLVKKHNFSASFVLIASMSGYVVNKVCCIFHFPYKERPSFSSMTPPRPRERERERETHTHTHMRADIVAVLFGFWQGTPNAAYAASKAGVHQLTRNLASEWGSSTDDEGPSIRVNSVSPGVIRTPMTAGVLSNGNLEHMWTEETMLKRLSAPEDYRGPIVFLLSDASSYVTGADLLVDGGYTGW